MNINEALQAISTLGFPIFACCYMFYIYQKQTEVITDLKIAINALIEKLDND